jgi:hypothetical protein
VAAEFELEGAAISGKDILKQGEVVGGAQSELNQYRL